MDICNQASTVHSPLNLPLFDTGTGILDAGLDTGVSDILAVELKTGVSDIRFVAQDTRTGILDGLGWSGGGGGGASGLRPIDLALRLKGAGGDD